MKLRLIGTEAECARLAFLLRFGPPGLEVLQVEGPYPNRGDSKQVRAYLEVRLQDVNPLVDRTFYSLIDPRAARCWSTPGATSSSARRADGWSIARLSSPTRSPTDAAQTAGGTRSRSPAAPARSTVHSSTRTT